jgi:hypothetical protein
MLVLPFFKVELFQSVFEMRFFNQHIFRLRFRQLHAFSTCTALPFSCMQAFCLALHKRKFSRGR